MALAIRKVNEDVLNSAVSGFLFLDSKYILRVLVGKAEYGSYCTI